MGKENHTFAAVARRSAGCTIVSQKGRKPRLLSAACAWVLPALLLLSAGALASCSASRRAAKAGVGVPVAEVDTLNYSPNTLIISYDPAVGSAPLLKAARRYGATILYRYQNFNMVALRLPEGKTLAEGIAHFQQVRGVLHVSRDRIYRLTDPVRPRPEVM